MGSSSRTTNSSSSSKVSSLADSCASSSAPGAGEDRAGTREGPSRTRKESRSNRWTSDTQVSNIV